jgi:thioredoxin 1
MDDSIEKLDTVGFEAAVTGRPGPALVLFTAPWCTVCRGIEPEARELAEANSWGMTVRRVVVDDDPDLAARFGIRSIPAALLFVDGDVVERIQPRGAGELRSALEKALPTG